MHAVQDGLSPSSARQTLLLTKCFHAEVQEATKLGCNVTVGGVYQVYGWRRNFVVREKPDKRSLLERVPYQLQWLQHDAKSSQGRAQQRLALIDYKLRCNRYSNATFGPFEYPLCAAIRIGEAQALVVWQIPWRQERRALSQIGRCSAKHEMVRAQKARNQSAVAQMANPKHGIVSLLDEVHKSIGKR